jgi:PhoH-like ATPase
LNPEGLDAAAPKSRSTRKSAPRRETQEVEAPAMTKVPVAPPASRKSEPLPAYKGERRAAPARAATPKKKNTGPTKLFVLDTNVLMHDPMCLFRFEEHDVYLPMIVLEELDSNKKGMTEVARNARQTSRSLDALVASHNADIITGIKLDSTGHIEVGGRLFFQTEPLNFTLPSSLPQGKADNQILGVVKALGQLHSPRDVVLVSKDINMRVKARALGLQAEDYQNDKTLEDGDLLYPGSLALPADFWIKHGKTVESWQQGTNTFYRITGPIVPSLLMNQFVYFEAAGETSLYARVTEIRGKTAVLRTLKDFTNQKKSVWGVTTRNR